MEKITHRLTDANLRQAKAGARLPDGDGLYFHCTSEGRGSFEFRFSLHGRGRWMGLGAYPKKISLAAARKNAGEFRSLVARGIDPIYERRIDRIKKRREAKKNTTFKACSEELIGLRFAGDGYKDPERAAARMRDGLTSYVYPIIGSLPVGVIDTDLVIEVLKPIWTTKPLTPRGSIAECRRNRSFVAPSSPGSQAYPETSAVRPAIMRRHARVPVAVRNWLLNLCFFTFDPICSVFPFTQQCLNVDPECPDMKVDLVTEGRLIDIVADGFDAGIRPRGVVPGDMIAVPFGADLRFAVVGLPAYFEKNPPPRTPGDLMRYHCIRGRLPSGALYRWDVPASLRAFIDVIREIEPPPDDRSPRRQR